MTRPISRRPGDGVRHEVDDELCQGGVEGPILERQLLGGRSSHVDRRDGAPASGRDESFGRIDRRHGRRPQPPDELGGQGTRATADIEHPLSGGDRGELGERGASGAEYLPMNRS